MDTSKALWKASGVFAPGYPRHSSDCHTIQTDRHSRVAFCEALNSAIEHEMPGYYSVYSFPRGHSRDGNIPKVDCVFIDLDVSDEYDPKNGDTEFSSWRRDMSALLARVRMIADAILDSGEEQHFRATLSGHKGLHLYLDFPTIAPNNGSFEEFKVGLKQYGEQVMSWLDETAGGVNISKWVDVDASDLGRLARHPNTIHHGASYDDTTRWCVPVTIEELSELKVNDYLELTKQPRWLEGYSRTPSESAGNKVAQAIRTTSTSSRSTSKRASVYDKGAVSAYEKESNESITLDDVLFLTSNFPCIEAFRERGDAYEHGNSSHLMEVNVIGKLVELNVPKEVIHEFLKPIPGYEEETTNEMINTVIGRSYNSFNCQKIADRAPTFCLGETCSVYQRSDDIEK